MHGANFLFFASILVSRGWWTSVFEDGGACMPSRGPLPGVACIDPDPQCSSVVSLTARRGRFDLKLA